MQGLAERVRPTSLQDVSQPTSTTRPLTVLSAYTGLGGMDLGLEAAGFASVGCLEHEHDAQLSLKANRGHAWRLLGDGDVAGTGAHLTPTDLDLEVGELDLLAGAPPCQPFSKAAQWSPTSRLGAADPRSKCLGDLLDLAIRLVPKVIIVENVPGYLRGPASILSDLEARVSKLSRITAHQYQLEWRIVDAANYGVHQHRRRVIIIISRCGLLTWPKQESDYRTAWDAIGEPPNDHVVPNARGKWAALLPTIPEGKNYQWHTERGGGEPLFGYRTRYSSFLKKLDRSKPSPTLAANPGPAIGPFHWDSRPLSCWEMLRLQTFPGTWRIEGDRRSRVRQIGNATPPLLAEVFGEAIAQCLGIQMDKNRAFEIPQNDAPFVPSLAKGLPQQYRSLIGEHPSHPGTGQGPRPRTRAIVHQS